METAASALLNTLHFTTNTTTANNKTKLYKISRNYLRLISSFPRKASFSLKKLHFNGLISHTSSGSDPYPSHKLAVLLEIEGVLMDVFRLCNREAFNNAFSKLGLDCANWPEPVYLDLLRRSSGDEQDMLTFFFDKIGWPTSVPTSEKRMFIKRVLREKKIALEDLVKSEDSPLRPGVEAFIDNAEEEGVPVVILTSYSTNGEKLARSIVDKLGKARISKIKIVGEEEIKNSFYGQLVYNTRVSLEEQLAKELVEAASSRKQSIAEEVAAMLALKVELNNTPTERLQSVVAALRAGAEYADVAVPKCVLIAGTQLGVVGAERVGMPCIVLRSSVTARAEFPSTMATVDGFGGADLTISRLRKKLST